MTEKLVVRHLSAWFGKTRALHDINLGLRGESGDRDNRSFGMRQIDAGALPQPHARSGAGRDGPRAK